MFMSQYQKELQFSRRQVEGSHRLEGHYINTNDLIIDALHKLSEGQLIATQMPAAVLEALQSTMLQEKLQPSEEATETDDPYQEPGTKAESGVVLQNHFGIKDREFLDKLEHASSAANALSMHMDGWPEATGLSESLQAIHGRLFADVYPWAGELRENTGVMVKNRGDYEVCYGDSSHIERELKKLSRKFEEEPLVGLTKEDFCQRLAFYYTEIDAIHPFREGNSRTLREWCNTVADKHGFTIDWYAIAESPTAREAFYMARDRGVVEADSAPIAAIFQKHCSIAEDHLYRESHATQRIEMHLREAAKGLIKAYQPGYFMAAQEAVSSGRVDRFLAIPEVSAGLAQYSLNAEAAKQVISDACVDINEKMMKDIREVADFAERISSETGVQSIAAPALKLKDRIKEISHTEKEAVNTALAPKLG